MRADEESRLGLLLQAPHRTPGPARTGRPSDLRSRLPAGYRAWATTPLTEPPKVSVVVPAYNEEWRILPTIGAICTEMCSRGEPWELIISDDGSSDRTAELVEALGMPNLRVLRSPNTGKGGAVRRGVQVARGECVLFADADQSTPIEQVGSLLDKVRLEGFDLAVGSRAVEGADVANKSFVRHIVSAGLQVIVRFGFRIPIRDTQCGFKLFSGAAAEQLFAVQRIDGFSFDLEILYLARRAGLTTAEVPVEWIDSPGSKVDPARVSVQFLRDLVRIRIWQARGLYRQHTDRSVGVSSTMSRTTP